MKTRRLYIDLGAVLIDGTDLDVQVEFDYHPGSPGCMYLRNGDPGYPPEPAEIDIVRLCDLETSAVLEWSQVCTLSQEYIIQACHEWGEADEPDDE